MKRVVSYIVAGVAVIAVSAYLVFFLTVASKERHELRCGGVVIEVADSVSRKFITASDVADCIRHEYGECEGMLVEKIDMTKIEDILRAKNAVLSAEAYITPDGILNIEVVQRVPVLRFKNDEEDFYMDTDGYVFHLQTAGTAKIMTVGGHFLVRVEEDFQGVPAEKDGGKWLNDMLALSKALTEMGMDVALEVSEGGDIVLTPTEGHPQFIFGRPENFIGKLRKMGEYYSVIVPREGADTYATVILKYDGQIVCRK